MLYSRSEIPDRATRFGQRYGCTFEKELGFGFDGIVFSTTCQSAIKAFRYEQLYRRERDVYRRLVDEGILTVRGFNVPRMIRSDDELWIVEMTIVRPPFVLDFAGAYFDQRPNYPDEVMAEWRAEKAEQFGDNWPEVRRIMAEFAAFGIYLADVKPGNIEFP